MRKLIYLFLLIPSLCFAQSNDGTLTNQVNTTIRGKTYSPTTAANMHQAIIDSKLNINTNTTVTATGTDTFFADVDPPISSYLSGYMIRVKFTNANTGASTINLNSLGAKSLKKNVSSDLASGDIRPGEIKILVYDGTNFQVTNVGSGAGLVDADYGDITVTGAGTVMTIDNLTVTNAKINDVAYSKITSVPDAVADGSTKGVSSFTAVDFNSSSGNISTDYTNGQSASGSTKGYLTSTDWTTFNNKAVQVIEVTFDGQGSVVLVGTKAYIRIPQSGTISGWSIVAEGSSPTCTLDVWKVGTGTSLPTVGNTITASAKPALATGNALTSTTLTGWTTSTTTDDIICVTVDACTAATKIHFLIYK